jgi:hypothetical protein
MKTRLKDQSPGYGSLIPYACGFGRPRPYFAPALEIRAHRPMGTQH